MNKNKKQPIIKTSINDYKVNPLQFSEITTPEIAYILGLLWADGNLSKKNNIISISILKKDMETIEKHFFKTGNWNSYIFKPKNSKKYQKQLFTSNNLLHNFLTKNNYKSKSLESADKILSQIPENLQHYWFLGLIDGDGCFHLRKKYRCKEIIIASGYNQNWSFLEKLCKKLNIDFKIKKRKQVKKDGKIHKNSIFVITIARDIEIFGNYIYQNYNKDLIGFPRKYKKFLQIIKYTKEFQNSKKFKYIGVAFDERIKKYYAKVKHKGIQKRLGSFLTLEEAAKCYDIKAIEIWGEKARTNKKLFGLK